MKHIISSLIILCFVAASLAAGPQDSTSPVKEKCPACRMFVSMFVDWNSRIEFKDSSHAIFDGTKCMFKYYLDMKKYHPQKRKSDIIAISVKDYSKGSIDARQAYFVIWSDVYGPMGHEPIPFEREAAAREFLKEDKGKKILRFSDINFAVIKALDNP